MLKLCIVEGCDKTSKKKSMCYMHYGRLYRRGSVSPIPLRRSSNKGKSASYKASYIRSYKQEKGCHDCGYKEHHSALDFDHRPGTAKIRDIKTGNSFGWVALLEEISKCDVVCANCHRIRTYNRVAERKVT